MLSQVMENFITASHIWLIFGLLIFENSMFSLPKHYIPNGCLHLLQLMSQCVSGECTKFSAYTIKPLILNSYVQFICQCKATSSAELKFNSKIQTYKRKRKANNRQQQHTKYSTKNRISIITFMKENNRMNYIVCVSKCIPSQTVDNY